MGPLASNVPIQAMPNYIVRRRWKKRAPVAKAKGSVTGARCRGGQDLVCGIADAGSAERDFEEQLSAMFAFFASPAGKRIGNVIPEGQINSEFVATKKSRFVVANSNWNYLWPGIAAGRFK